MGVNQCLGFDISMFIMYEPFYHGFPFSNIIYIFFIYVDINYVFCYPKNMEYPNLELLFTHRALGLLIKPLEELCTSIVFDI